MVVDEEPNSADMVGELFGEGQDKVSRTSRETRWRKVLLKRSIWLVCPLALAT